MEIITVIIAVIFDLDGLLLMTEGIYDQMFADYGWLHAKKKLSPSKFNIMRAQQFGAGTEASARVMLRAYGIPETVEELQKYLAWRDQYGLDLKFQQTLAFDGAKELITKLHQNNIPIALATSSTRELLQAKATNHPWLSEAFGSNVVTGNDVTHKKPHPESFLKSARLLGIPEDQFNHVLVIEDAPNGVEAAKAAGMPVIAIPDPRLPDPATNLAGADQILTSLTEFQPQQWGLNLST